MSPPDQRKRIVALTHPMVDILVSCEHKVLSDLSLAPGTYATLERAEQDTLLEACSHIQSKIVNGGSAANSVACIHLLGVKASLMGLAGDDTFGHHFVDEFKRADINLCNPLVPGARTATCVSLVTPDSERTMRTHLGVSKNFSESDLDKVAIAESRWLLLEAYFLSASEENRTALRAALQHAKASSTLLAFSTAAEFIVERFRQELLTDIIPALDLVFANSSEAKLLTGCPSVEDAFVQLASLAPGVIVTDGLRGAHVSFAGVRFHQPAFDVGLGAVDSTGAGDAFTGTFLAAITQGLSPQIAARGAARIAAEVVTRQHSRAPDNTQRLFTEAIRKG